MRTVRLNDIGAVIDLTVKDLKGAKIDAALSSATRRVILFERPSKTTFERTATYTATSRLQYVTADGDLNEVGDWTAQGYVELANGYKGHTTLFVFHVERVIGA